MALQASQRIRIQSFLYSVSLLVALGILGGILWFKFKPAKFDVFEDAPLHVSMKYPANWQKVEHPAEGAIVAFVAPKKDELDPFSPNMNLTYVDLKQKLTFDQLRQVTMMQMGALFKNQ